MASLEQASGALEESSSSSSLVNSYIGCLISLTSKSEIRYEGLLVSINPQQSTIALQNVRSYGTEGRRKDGTQIPSSDKEYEYILFRGSDIKDLQVKSSSFTHTAQQNHTDPAIIQSEYACAPNAQRSAASVEGGHVTSVNSKVMHSDLIRQSVPSTQPLCQTGAHQSPWASSTFIANADGSINSQGYAGMSSSQAYPQKQYVPFQPHTATLQNLLQRPAGYAVTGIQQFPELATPTIFPSQFELSNPTYSSSVLSSNTSLASVLPSHLPTEPSHDSSNQELHNKSLIPSKAGPYPSVSLTVSSLPASSVNLGSASGPITIVSPPLAPDHLMSSVTAETSSVGNVYTEQNDMGSQVPLLPVSTSQQLGKHMEKQFNEEFDFTAMNEKFNKHEVWGSLGKDKHQGTIGDGIEDAPAHHSKVFDGYVQDTPKPGSQPVYNKDDFFDTLSCNTLNRGAWSGRTKFSERMRLDSETFGDFQQRPPAGRGNYGASSYSGNYRAPYNLGRGYGH